MFRYFIACLVALAFLGPSLSRAEGEGPALVYKAHKKRIHAERLCRIEGYVFAYGAAVPRTKSKTAQHAAVDKAALRAEAQLTALAFEKIAWPAHLSHRQKEIFFQQYQNVAPLTIKASGKLRVDSGRYGKEYFAVVAVPKNSIEVPSIEFKQIKHVLDVAFQERAAALSLAAYLEICSAEKLGLAVRRFAERLTKRYGSFVGQVVKGFPVSGPGVLWKKGNRLPYEKIAGLTKDDLLRLLGINPYDPVVLFALGKAFEKSGFSRASQLFFLRGTVWRLDDEYNKKCREGIYDDYFMALLTTLDSEFAGTRRKVRERYGAVGPFQGKLADLVAQSMGTMPLRYTGPESTALGQVRSVLSSGPPNIEEAQRLIEVSLDEAPSVAMFKLMAQVLEMRGEPLLALPFHMQAGSTPGHAGL